MGKRVRISNSRLNCYGTRVLTSGVEMDQYLKNPILLWMHLRGVAIGTIKDIQVEGDDITGELEFDGIREESKLCKLQYEAGTLKMVSANFEIIETSEAPEYILSGQYRPTITKSKLVEVSLVDIGGNDDALVLSRDGKLIKLSAGEESAGLPLLSKKNNKNKIEKEMDYKAIALKLGLSETATEQEILDKITICLAYQASNVALKNELETIKLSGITMAVDEAIAVKKITADKKEQLIALGKVIGLQKLNETLALIQSVQRPIEMLNLSSDIPGGISLAKKLSELSPAEMISLRKENREEYAKLYQAEYHKAPLFEE